MTQAETLLAELVRLKNLKDKAKGMNSFARGSPGRIRSEMLKEYEQGKEPAWEAARAYLRQIEGT